MFYFLISEFKILFRLKKIDHDSDNYDIMVQLVCASCIEAIRYRKWLILWIRYKRRQR